MHTDKKLKAPRLVFSPWKRWGDRHSLNEDIKNFPGVYLIAHFQVPPAGPANTQAREIIYIGETCEQSLQARLQQFEISAFEDRPAHGGGTTYRNLYRTDLRRRRNQLFVAVFPVKSLPLKIRAFFIRHIERRLIWDYARRWVQAPECNKE